LVEKKQILKKFKDGRTIDQLAEDHNFTKLTISRNLKKTLGEKVYKELLVKNKSKVKNIEDKKEINPIDDSNKFNSKNANENFEDQFLQETTFMEITPLDCEIENIPQKDFSSVHVSEIEFPKTVYIVVDKKIELEIKYLKDYPNWQFLSQEDLNRKTIEIHSELKNAKRFCNKDQKVIKVPNTDIFRIVAPHLISRGITRIVSDDKLIAL